ncbi:uncharacterized protein [Gossypium hirsutum]|uniref:Retrotransposon gag domain-containing protein n=1 Tax=Gossypium hirsutum TaxID=3635 RepID=A0A1U8NFW8_GOSHI|nr:uncharacterized protein LOC107947900 [Gossypium hirsutum]
MEMMTALVKEKGPMQSLDTMEPQLSGSALSPRIHFTSCTCNAKRMFSRRTCKLGAMTQIARLKMDDHDFQDKYRSLEGRLKAIEGTEVFSALSAKELSLVPNLDSLVRSAFRWYNQLCRERIRSWKDLTSVFCVQYKHVSDKVPDRLTLQMMKKKPTETFRQYAQRWRDISAQVEPPLTKTKITVLFINTLKAPFYDKLVGSAMKDFADIVISRELIENAIKNGRMEGSESSKRAAPVKKKKAKAHMVGTESHHTSNPYPVQPRPRYRPPPNFYYPPQGPYYQAPPPYPVYATDNQRPFAMFPPNTMPAQSQPKKEQRPTRSNPEKPQFTPIPVSYGELNTAGNPLPNHIEGNVSALTKEDRWHAKSCVSEIKTPMRKIWESCERFRKLFQDMMDNKEVEIFNKMKEGNEGEVCTSDNQSSGFPYRANRPLKDNRAVPWKYDVNIIIPESEKSKVTTGNVGEVGHFTRSERCYSKAVEPMKKTNDLKQEGKAPMQEAEVELETPSEQEVKRPVNEEEAYESLKFIKHSEYNVVEQLSK